MIKVKKNKLKTVLVIGSCVAIFSSFTLSNLAKAEILGNWDDEDAYRPAPVLFLHGFGPGSPTATWTEDIDHHPNIDLKLKPYFDKYFDGYAGDPTILADSRYPYLEVMSFIDFTQNVSSQFIDRNSSVDTYQLGDYYVEHGYNGVKRNPGDFGWSDKVDKELNKVLSGYGTDKVILVCHSMGGLAAREYFRAFNGGNNALRLITIATPHLGSDLAKYTRFARRTQKIGWFFPGLGWIFSSTVESMSIYFSGPRELKDPEGDAIRDMVSASDFLNTINSSLQPQGIDYFVIYGDVWWYIGDGVVSLDSAQGQGVLALKDKAKVYASHENVPIIASQGDPSILLKFIDYTKPVVEITSPDPDATYLPEINSLSFHVQGELSQEYLPADSLLKIEIKKEGDALATVAKQGKLLQPSDLWNPNDDNSIVAEFDEEITVSQVGIYTILVTVTNPAGFVSETKTARVKLTDIPGTGGDWRDVLSLLNQKRADVKKGPISVSHPEAIDMDGVFTIRQGTVDILADYGFTGLADALNCAGYAQSTWSEGFGYKNEIRDVLYLMHIGSCTYINLLIEFSLKYKRTMQELYFGFSYNHHGPCEDVRYMLGPMLISTSTEFLPYEYHYRHFEYPEGIITHPEGEVITVTERGGPYHLNFTSQFELKSVETYVAEKGYKFGKVISEEDLLTYESDTRMWDVMVTSEVCGFQMVSVPITILGSEWWKSRFPGPNGGFINIELPANSEAKYYYDWMNKYNAKFTYSYHE